MLLGLAAKASLNDRPPQTVLSMEKMRMRMRMDEGQPTSLPVLAVHQVLGTERRRGPDMRRLLSLKLGDRKGQYKNPTSP